MNRNVVYIRVLLVIVALVVLLAFANRSPHHARHDPWLPSSFNPVGEGTMALYETLRDEHWPVQRWRDPLGRLSGTGNVLIVTRSQANWRVAFSEQEADLLDQWVRNGNTLFLAGALDEWPDTRMLLRRIGFTLPADMAGDNSITSLLHSFDSHTDQQIELDPAPEESGKLVIPSTKPLPFGFPPGSKILWQTQGQPYVIEIPLGAGRVVCAASARLLSNGWLDRGDNLAVVLHLLSPGGQAPRHLLFEESHHGYSAIYAATRLLDHPGVRFAAMLALLGALTFLGSSLIRFGPVVPLQRKTGRSTLEFIDSIADL